MTTPLAAFRKSLSRIKYAYRGLPHVDLQTEAAPYIGFLHGTVLNAGAGHRPLTLPLRVLNCDFDESAPVHFLADLHYIPLQDEAVDSIISIAVLEHTRLPWVCAAEFYRVMKPGGTLVLCVPFLQPEHAVPHDFFRYTVYGLRSMLEYAGFEVDSVERLGRYHRALSWILMEKWKAYGLLKMPLMVFVNLLARRAVTGDHFPHSVYTGSYAVARKPGIRLDTSQDKEIASDTADWFYPLLVDPISKTPLEFCDGGFVSADNRRYGFHFGKLDLRPHDPSQDKEHKWGSRSTAADANHHDA